MRHLDSRFILLFLAGCSVDLRIPPDTQIACKVAADCPSTMSCDTPSSRCIAQDGALPVVSISTIARSLDTVSIPITVHSPGDSTVTLHAQLVNAQQAPVDIQLVSGAAPASASGTTSTVQWDAAGYFQNASQHDNLVVQLRATGSKGTGAITKSESFSFGDDAPLAVFTAATRAALQSPVQENVVLEVLVSDSFADPSSLQIQYRINPGRDPNATVVWQDASIALGDTEALATSITGVSYIVAWNSEATSGGIGTMAATDVELRVRASDQPTSAPQPGAWDTVQGITISNQHPPVLSNVRSRRAEVGGGLGPVLIGFTLTDEESDPADIALDYSFDLGTTWTRAQEYQSPYSDGLRALQSSPIAVGGLTHVVAWDPSGTTFANTRALIRLRVADHSAEGTPVVLPLSEPLGAPPGGPDLFAAPTTLATNSTYASSEVHAAKMNGDGLLDLVALHFDDTTSTMEISVLLQNANHTFSAQPKVVAGGGYQSTAGDYLTIGDFDGDTHNDVAITSANIDLSATQSVTVWFGDGTGALTNKQTIVVPSRPAGIIAEDFDGDGRAEIIAQTAFGVSQITFSAARVATTTANILSATSFAPQSVNPIAADINGDGKLDVVVPDKWPADFNLVFLQNTTTAGSPLSWGFSQTSLNLAPDAVAAADFNRDGHVDVAAVYPLEGQMQILEGNGDFTFGRTTRFSPGAQCSGLQTTFLNDDDVPDLAYGLTNDASASVQLFIMQPGAPGDPPAMAPARQFALGGSGTFTAVDVDGDGISDLLSGASSGVRFARGQRSWGVTDANFSLMLSTQLPRVGAQMAVARDFDGDALPDVAVSGLDTTTGKDYVIILRATGSPRIADGGFSVTQIFDLDTAAAPRLALGDVNGDGMTDIAVVSSAEMHLLIGQGQEGVGDGTFVDEGTKYPTNGAVMRAAFVDLNEDGKDDLVTINQDATNSLAIFLTPGTSGHALAPAKMLAVCQGYDVGVGDLNNDGHQDVLVLCNTQLIAFLGDGTGALTAQPPVSTDANASGMMTLGDLNGDGILDAWVCGDSQEYAAIGQGANGVGNGTYVTAPDGPTVVPRSAVLADFDGDGVLDHVETTLFGNVVATAGTQATGFGNGTWSAPQALQSAGALPIVFSADFSADGLPDIGFVNSGGQLLVRWGLAQEMRSSFARLATVMPDVASVSATPAIVGTRLDTVADFFGLAAPPPTITRRTNRTHDGTDFLASLRSGARALNIPTNLRPLTHAIYFGSDRRLTAATVPSPSGPLPGFAVADALVDKSSGGFVVDLPIEALYESNAATGTLVVYRETSDWLRASDSPADVQTGAKTSTLPLWACPTCSNGVRQIVAERPQWTRIPRASGDNLANGSGPRFAFIGMSTIRVYTDQLGTFQAFFQ